MVNKALLRVKGLPMQQDRAVALAVEALGWLAANDELRPVFLGATGLQGDEVATRAQDPEFLGFVLDFLVMDDTWVQAFYDHANVPYDAPMTARAALPGGEVPNWT